MTRYDSFLRAEEGPVLQEIKESGFCKPGGKREGSCQVGNGQWWPWAETKRGGR